VDAKKGCTDGAVVRTIYHVQRCVIAWVTAATRHNPVEHLEDDDV